MASSPCNAILHDRLTAWVVQNIPLPRSTHEERVFEWDDAQYLLQRTCEGAISLSLAMHQAMHQSRDKVREGVQAAFKGIAVAREQPLEGFDVTLDVNVRMLSRLDVRQQEFWVRELSALRLAVMATPLREHFQRLIEGTSQEGAIEPHCSRPDQTYYLQPQPHCIRVIFPIRFKTEFDASVGKTFLQEFVEVGRLPVLGKSPSCQYSQDQPPELQQLGLDALGDANGGFVSFTFEKRHVSGPQIQNVLWSVCSFYLLISCHLKACKAAMHSKMRERMDGTIRRIEATRPAWEMAA